MATKTFDGKNYFKYKFTTTKAEADKSAKWLRGRGYLARVVKESDGYCVYRR
jgi:hypothetical protein